MSDMHEILRTIVPTEEYCPIENLFVNKKDSCCEFNGKLTNVCLYQFNTWMNLFAAKKYYYYCDLGNLYLKLKVKGNYKVIVTGCNLSTAFGRIDEVILEKDCIDENYILIPNAQDYEGIFFEIAEDKNHPIEFNGASWCTDTAPKRDNKLAIISCTFKREKYITKNIKAFETFIKENPSLKSKVKLFISDNGKSLPAELNSENVVIYPNINAGGAGGFTRGLIEVIKLNQNYTRILFMDDDVEFFTESFYRTLITSNYLKEEFQNSILHGAMLDLYEKNIFHESLAIETKDWVSAYHYRKNISELNQVLETNRYDTNLYKTDAQNKVSSAWWYCSFALETFEKKGLPIPLFFRCDDIEYSWRNQGLHHIQFNGVCVWHAPFKWRASRVIANYYNKRNYFLVKGLYSNNAKKIILKTFRKDFATNLKRYDYEACEIYLKAIEDFMSGVKSFKCNPEEQFKELNAINKKVKYHSCHNIYELKNAKQHNVKCQWWRKILYSLTSNGLFCPDFLFKKSEIALDWETNTLAFKLVKEVKIYNLLTETYQIRKFDRKKFVQLKKQYSRLYKNLNKNYKTICAEYKKSIPEITNMQFWENYLGIACTTKETEKELSNV